MTQQLVACLIAGVLSVSEQIVLAGFSQGGAVALDASLRSIHKLGGCIALSTWLPLRQQYPSSLGPHAASLRLLQVHGDEDSVVHYSWGKMSFDLLRSFITDSDRAPAFVTIAGMGHISSDKEEIATVKHFLHEVLH